MGCSPSTSQVAKPVDASIQPNCNTVSVVADVRDVKDRVVGKIVGRPLIVDHSIDGDGVVMYNIAANGIVVNKRFTDFKAFHATLQSAFPLLPPLPPSGLLTALRRSDPALIQERRARFDDLLSVAPSDHLSEFLAIAIDDSRPLVGSAPVQAIKSTGLVAV
ncbi:hypothetical protein H310_01326 [Aphanomyces invadans]|uniref:PX domain-containing protein n=1 Tax=Aphanomyces invadans TaxID=157072 RepID=A0A024UR87_9STRA|nr:hypothetical protein H310_01326 [Aphanomyces invadans]ETW08819.1 hypothetical protein H310_01326 [Aphanomyces invadans]|eukprot:XP_008862624.1 hypothetical protein H310_01326 [Aphanomyces invadans]